MHQQIFSDGAVMRHVFSGEVMSIADSERVIRDNFNFGDRQTGMATLVQQQDARRNKSLPAILIVDDPINGQGVRRVMTKQRSVPVPRMTVITLGVQDMRTSIAFYEALGFARKARDSGDAIAFFETGGAVLALFPWDKLAQDATLPDHPRPQAFRGSTLAWNCRSAEEVDAVLAFAVNCGASLLKPPHQTDYGGYSGYFADPDGHAWDVVVAPGIEVGDDRRVHLSD